MTFPVPEASATIIPFETIKRFNDLEEKPYIYEGRNPTLFIFADEATVNRSRHILSPETQATLGEVAFDHYVVLGAYQGSRDNLWLPGRGIEIQEVLRAGAVVTVVSVIHVPGPDEVERPISASPYHLVKVPQDMVRGDIEVVLVVDGVQKARKLYHIP